MENAPFVILNLFPIWLTLVSVVVTVRTYSKQWLCSLNVHVVCWPLAIIILRFRSLAMDLLSKNNWLAPTIFRFKLLAMALFPKNS